MRDTLESDSVTYDEILRLRLRMTNKPIVLAVEAILRFNVI